jgi:hypothetical protein
MRLVKRTFFCHEHPSMLHQLLERAQFGTTGFPALEFVGVLEQQLH